jgi:hypothetical protein
MSFGAEIERKREPEDGATYVHVRVLLHVDVLM